MRTAFLAPALAVLLTSAAAADVQVSERHALKDSLKAGGQDHTLRSAGNGTRTGEQALTDSSGLEFFVNTNITFSTSSSASGAASEASYTAAVNADTSGGGTVSTTLSDAFDGYNSLCVSTNGATGPCVTSGGGGENRGSTSVTMYNDNGAATLECGGRQVVFPPQTIDGLSVQRKVFVPTVGEFARWANFVTNPTAAPISVTLITGNNLGSDGSTLLVTSSDGDATAETSDLWVTSFQNFSGTTSSDVRLGHVFQGAGAPIPMTGITFVNGDDNPFWSYTFSVTPGETRIILNYVTGQPTRADAAAAAAAIAGAPSTECLTSTEINQIANFAFGGPPPPNVLEVPTASNLGLAALALLLTGAAVTILRRR